MKKFLFLLLLLVTYFYFTQDAKKIIGKPIEIGNQLTQIESGTYKTNCHPNEDDLHISVNRKGLASLIL